MMRNIPIFATILALSAIVIMMRLGFWQLDRETEKEALYDRYSNASSLPEISYPTIADPDQLQLFRRSSINCYEVVSWSSISGKNTKDESGIAHVAQCKTAGTEGLGAENSGVEVAVGWSKSPESPKWNGGIVRGIITEGRIQPFKLVVQQPIEGLSILRAPDPLNIPNPHFLYAIQWFLFSFFAAIIYIFAARKRMKDN